MSHPEFNPTCPEGGKWYACGNGAQFVGCCLSDPCSDDGCNNGDVTPASFSGQYYPSTDAYLDQNCTTRTLASFYICKYTDPPFFGCCNSNPCKQNGCPSSDLAQIVLASNLTRAAAMDPHPPISSGSRKLSVGGIIGVSISGVVILSLIIGALCWLCKRRKRRRQEDINRAQEVDVKPSPQDKQEKSPVDPPAPEYGAIQPHIHEADHGTRAASQPQTWLRSPTVHDRNRNSTAVSELSVPQTLPSSFYNAYRQPSDMGYARSLSYSKSMQQSPIAPQEPLELDGSGRHA